MNRPEDNVVLEGNPAEIRTRMSKLSRRGLLWTGVAVAAGLTIDRYINYSKKVDGLVAPLRNALDLNQSVWQPVVSEARLAPTFDKSLAGEPRVNGDDGLGDDFDPADWKLLVQVPSQKDLTLDLDAVKALPKIEQVTDLKCIEGWSQIVHWEGVRFKDFVAKYAPTATKFSYVGMETPDAGYYVGLDMPSALHPQTLLCYRMNGEDLSLDHGAPLRLVIPVKYGVKNIRRIGRIFFSNERPRDFWAEQAYDWFAGL